MTQENPNDDRTVLARWAADWHTGFYDNDWYAYRPGQGGVEAMLAPDEWIELSVLYTALVQRFPEVAE